MSLSFLNRVVLGWIMILVLTIARSALGDLLVHYEFEATEGVPPDETTLDSSSFAKTGTLAGGPLPGTNYPMITLGNGPDGSNSMQFFGGGGAAGANRVFVADGDVDLDTTFTAFTVALFLNPFDLSETDTRFFMGKMGLGGQRGWQMGRLPGNHVEHPAGMVFTYFDGPSGAAYEVNIDNPFTENAWTHVAVVFEANTSLDIYIDGVPTFQETTVVLGALNGANSAAFQVGNRGNNIFSSWVGWLDDVRVYNNALTAQEIEDLADVSPPVPGDVNMDGFVDIFDVNLVSAHWNETGPAGDANGDMIVDIFDVNLISANWAPAPPPGGAAVPEPATLGLAILAAAGLCIALRTRRRT